MMKDDLPYFLFPVTFFCSFPAVMNKRIVYLRQLSAAESGIHFNNDIHDNDSSHSFINEFGYMGGGVGIGDFNNDGLKDIFFTGNQVSCRLYINKGNNQFDDITEKAGIGTDVWAPVLVLWISIMMDMMIFMCVCLEKTC